MTELAKGPVEWHQDFILDANGVRWDWINDPQDGWLFRHSDGTTIKVATDSEHLRVRLADLERRVTALESETRP